MLTAGGQQRVRKRNGNRMEVDEDEDEDEDAEAPANLDLGVWSRRDLGQLGSSVPPYQKPVLEDDDHDRLMELKNASALELYKQFQPDRFAEEVVYQSKLYAVQKNKNKAVDIINLNTYRYSLV
jgi:hypothetical protein